MTTTITPNTYTFTKPHSPLITFEEMFSRSPLSLGHIATKPQINYSSANPEAVLSPKRATTTTPLTPSPLRNQFNPISSYKAPPTNYPTPPQSAGAQSDPWANADFSIFESPIRETKDAGPLLKAFGTGSSCQTGGNKLQDQSAAKIIGALPNLDYMFR